MNPVKPLVDSIIALRTGLKQYYIQKIKEQQLDITYEMLQVLAALWKKEQMNQQDIATAIQKNKARYSHSNTEEQSKCHSADR